jgi:2-C-methyl-D-erythritol 4-phosphate cytidylyltransferase/2-C-methyl-D-erythritol 2,4-cyclodiphosphate synthase
MRERGRTVGLVVAAGSGSRAGGELPKQYLKLAGKALVAHALEHFRHAAVDEIRFVIGAGQEDLFRDAVGDEALPAPVIGGDTRQRSVRNGLEAIAGDGGAGAVLIHDAARPFLPASVVDRLLAALEAEAGAVPVLPVVDSLARANGILADPVPRAGLVRVQTPQAFRFGEILEAHRRWSGGADASDDAQVAQAAGLSIATVEGDRMLEKLTHPEDFREAEARLRARLIACTGSGFDVHAFAAGEDLWLGGILVPHSKGLSGHSDADVVLHALTDALLGAIGAGDIGDHFPPSDPQWRGAASSRFVEHARAMIEARGGRIDHADVTIICEAPKIGPYKQAMRERIACLLRLPASRISIKATTTERLGFTGRSEGIAAQAIATVRIPEQI